MNVIPDRNYGHFHDHPFTILLFKNIMELLTRQRTEYYLSAALAFLHQECIDWRMEVDLWLDEMVFFYKLIQQRKKDTSVSAEDTVAAEKELIAPSRRQD